VVGFLPQLLYDWIRASGTNWIGSWSGQLEDEKKSLILIGNQTNHDSLVAQPIAWSQYPISYPSSYIKNFRIGNFESMQNFCTF
jgi:hypothetical protein